MTGAESVAEFIDDLHFDGRPGLPIADHFPCSPAVLLAESSSDGKAFRSEDRFYVLNDLDQVLGVLLRLDAHSAPMFRATVRDPYQVTGGPSRVSMWTKSA